jgi:hypothetical protein
MRPTAASTAAACAALCHPRLILARSSLCRDRAAFDAVARRLAVAAGALAGGKRKPRRWHRADQLGTAVSAVSAELVGLSKRALVATSDAGY